RRADRGHVGKRVKLLPTTIYWNGLQRFGVIRYPGSAEQVAGAMARQPAPVDELLAEQVDRVDRVWHHNLPPPAAGCPNVDSLEFALEPAEADWLAERIVASTS